MAESSFIKTVVFGGYDKNDVNKRLDAAYALCCDSRNKFREIKLLYEKMKAGSSEQDAIDSVFATERAKITELQVKTQNLIDKGRSLSDELVHKNQELQELKEKYEAMEAELNEAKAKLASENGTNSGAMLNMVFQQAQSSANMILNTAKDQAAALESDSKKLAENTITDANNKAKIIIYNAETEAAKIVSEAKEKSMAMDVASGNIKAKILADVETMRGEISKFREIFDKFAVSGTDMFAKSDTFLSDASASLTAGGVPVFRMPDTVEEDLIEQPVLEDINETYITGNDKVLHEKKSDALLKLKERAESLNADGKSADKVEAKPVQTASKKKKSSLDDLMKKAESMQ